MSRTHVATLVTALLFLFAGSPVEAVQRAHVSASGLDSNTSFNCDVVNPCRFFQAAMTVVDANGEVVVLDSAGYGAVSITKSISLVAPTGVYAGISVFPGATGVTIGTAGVNVVLRGLTINGQGGNTGISITAGASLSIENCAIANFASNGAYGIYVDSAAKVSVIDTVLRNNSTSIWLQGGTTANISRVTILGSATGIFATGYTAAMTIAAISDAFISGSSNAGIVATTGGAGASFRVSVTRSTVSNGQYGILSSGPAGSVLTVSESMVTKNSYGLYREGAETFESLGNNAVRQNAFNTVGTITVVPNL